MPKTPDLIGSEEAEKILHISRSTLSRWVAAGRLPVAVRLSSGALVFWRSDVEALAATIADLDGVEPAAASA